MRGGVDLPALPQSIWSLRLDRFTPRFDGCVSQNREINFRSPNEEPNLSDAELDLEEHAALFASGVNHTAVAGHVVIGAAVSFHATLQQGESLTAVESLAHSESLRTGIGAVGVQRSVQEYATGDPSLSSLF